MMKNDKVYRSLYYYYYPSGTTEEPPTPQRKQSLAAEEAEAQEGDVLDSAPVISMVTNHTNGTLNLWQLTFDDKSKFSQVT